MDAGETTRPNRRRICLSPRRSLRARLSFAFIRVAGFTLFVALGVMGWRWHQGHGGPPWAGPPILVALVVAVAAGSFTARRIIRRLDHLRDAVERLDLHDLSVRVAVEGEDEIATLARAFNGMVARLEEAEHSRRRLFADVAHELRHPLAVLTGRLESLLDGAAPLDTEQVLRLQDEVLGLNRLVDDLRELSLADVGRLSLALAPVDLAELLGELQENLEPVAAAKQVTLHTAVVPSTPDLTADRDRLRQVLVNLITNALRHTPAGGRVEVLAEPDATGMRLSVADTGSGIPAEALPHLFERFYRTDESRTRTTGGSGLGLAIARSLVQLHGGTIEVQSELGRGSTFTVRLPLRPMN